MAKPLTQQQIANEIGVSRQTICAWKREGMDTSAANLPALRERAGHKKDRQEITREIQEARLRKLNAEAAAKEHALAVEEGRYILASDAKSAAMRAGTACRAAWEKIVDDLPPAMEGLTAIQMQAKLREYVRLKLTDLSQIFS